MRMALMTSLLLFIYSANAEEFNVKVEPFLMVAHLSEPFMKSHDVEIDFVGVGGTVMFSRVPSLEIDLALGQRYFGCSPWGDNPCGRWTFAFHGQIKWYPGRGK